MNGNVLAHHALTCSEEDTDDEPLELATAMLAITLSAVLLVTGSFHLERPEMHEARSPGAALTRQAGIREGLDIRQVSEVNPYMRPER